MRHRRSITRSPSSTPSARSADSQVASFTRSATVVLVAVGLFSASFGCGADEPLDGLESTESGVARSTSSSTAAGAILTQQAYYPSTLQSDLSPLTIRYPLAMTYEVDRNTSKGACIFNSAEVGDGVRIKGSFDISQTLSTSNWAVTFTTSSVTRKNPYMVNIGFDLGDVVMGSKGKVDLSAGCFGLDQALTITLKGVRATVTLGAPSTARTKFSYESTAIAIDSITVTGASGLLDTTVAAAIERELNDRKSEVVSGGQAALGGSLATLSVLADFSFGGDLNPKAKTMTSAMYFGSSTSGSGGKCKSVPCALYSFE